MFFNIVLVVFFRPPEDGCRDNLRYDRTGEFTRPGKGVPRRERPALLFRIVVEDHRPVVRPDIGALPVLLRRIVDRPEDREQVIVGYLVGIVQEPYGLRMPGCTGADRLVPGTGDGPAGIPDLG